MKKVIGYEAIVKIADSFGKHADDGEKIQVYISAGSEQLDSDDDVVGDEYGVSDDEIYFYLDGEDLEEGMEVADSVVIEVLDTHYLVG